ncbi:MAG: crossover junction endodeoxyribonuclease RuvC [Deltaproteobacteria bacterium]|nr:crossover junction endodeoxyribonuclease RuvC [Deltaproteobacteria bacterium]
MRILGIDPGTNATGFGVVERAGARLTHVAHGTLRPVRAQSMAARLAEIHSGLTALIALHSPTHVVIEKIFVAASSRSALVLGQARGVALAAVGAAGLPFDEIAPQQIKLAVTGNGAAEKVQVQAMVRRLLALDATPQRDAADALAAAICRAQRQGATSRALRALEGAPVAVSEARRLYELSASRKRGRGARAAQFVLRNSGAVAAAPTGRGSGSASDPAPRGSTVRAPRAEGERSSQRTTR